MILLDLSKDCLSVPGPLKTILFIHNKLNAKTSNATFLDCFYMFNEMRFFRDKTHLVGCFQICSTKTTLLKL